MAYIFKTMPFTSFCVDLYRTERCGKHSGTLFMQRLIDDYILPMIGQETPDFGNLFREIVRVAGFYLVGVAATYAYNRIMVTITQGTLKSLRDDLFEHMEKLPIKYFDTHSHGDIMSIYTNDIDYSASDDQPEYTAGIFQFYYRSGYAGKYAGTEYPADSSQSDHGGIDDVCHR